MTVRGRREHRGRPLTAPWVVLAVALVPMTAPAEQATQTPPTAPVAEASSEPADLLFAQGRFREAIGAYRRWLSGHPNDASAHNRLGMSLQKVGQAKQARREYEQAVKIDRCYAEAWNNLATLDHVRRKYKQAVAAYRKAVECKPEMARLHANLAAAYLEMGQLAQSARAYGEALRLDPAVLDTASLAGVSVTTGTGAKQYFDLAKVCATRGDLETALKLLLRARASGLPDFTRLVAEERAFAELLSDPRYAEQLR